MTSIELTPGDRRELNAHLDFEIDAFYPFAESFHHLFIDKDGFEHRVSVSQLKGVIEVG